MNTASRNELDRLLKEPVHGFSQCSDGLPAPGSACPLPAFTNAVTARAPSVITSMASSTHVSSAMNATPIVVTHSVCVARPPAPTRSRA